MNITEKLLICKMFLQIVKTQARNLITLSSRNMSTETQAFKPPGFFLGSGEPISKADFFDRIVTSRAPVIMIGENHEDPLAHAFELEILKKLKTAESHFALSLEFYDRECQTVLDEYLAGLIPLDTFLSDSRPPANHADYQPLLDLCKAVHLPVIAANCPRRYTRLVSKGGRDCLTPLASTSARQLLPPLPYIKELARNIEKNSYKS